MKIKAFINGIIDALDGFFAYLLTIVGILVSQYLPAFSAGQAVNIKIGIGRLVVSCVIAFVLVGQQEVGGDPAGKRARFWPRMGNALAHGLGWSALLKMI